VKEEYVLDLFTGGGGSCQAGRILRNFGYANWREVCFVEHNQFCQRNLRQRMRDQVIPEAAIWDDVTTFDPAPWSGIVSGVLAGYPCTPWAASGKHGGEEDPNNMWPHVFRVLRGVKSAKWCFLENSPLLCRSAYHGKILSDLASIGFDAIWQTRTASSVGANHKRSRFWQYCWRDVANTDSD